MSAAKRNALGKGLTALLADSETDITGKENVPVNHISEIPVNQIEANPFQPRENFDEVQLDELVSSIKIHGVIQPITVRKVGYDKYQIISGERRTRAAIRAGLKKIPGFVRVANDQNMLEMALIENTHRENLNAVEIAVSYKRLVDECGLSQDELAERVSKGRSTIVNYMRLLKLPEDIQIAICEDKLSMGHARAIINVEDPDVQLELFREILDKNLSVRKVEELVKRRKQAAKDVDMQGDDANEDIQRDDVMDVYAHKFSRFYNAPVNIKRKKGGKGEIVIPFASSDELKRISAMLDEMKSSK